MAKLNTQAATEPERFDALERAGFKTERFGDLIYQLGQYFGGHYMDTGTSSKIAQGLIKVKSNSLPISYTETGLPFENGDYLPADVVIFATGFTSNTRDSVRQFFGDEIYSRVVDHGGIDPEGEVRGAFVPTGHPGLWYMGGGIGEARWHSRFVALQILADLGGNPFPIYKETPTVKPSNA